MKNRYFIIGLIYFISACSNIEDVDPSQRKTFIRFYEEPRTLSGVSAEETESGYIIVGSEILSSKVNGLVIHTDKSGNEIRSERITLPGFTPRALKVSDEGYYISGDRIQFNPSAENLFDLTISSAMLYKISFAGDTSSYLAADTASSDKVDFRGNSVTVNNENNIVLLGTFKEARVGAFERPFITVLDPTSLDTVWSKRYDVLNRDYVNSKSVHTTANDNVIWASALLKDAGDLSRTYLAVPIVRNESVFVNSDLFGETTDQELLANDLQPAESKSFGYGLIGTYALPTGKQSNMFFVRVDQFGNFIADSERFIDGELSASNQPVAMGQSASEDTGDAITSTQDGGFILAGSILSTVNRGNGGRDIFLVKVDAFGDILWNKIIGGDGDEIVNSIRETSDGGLLICGSNIVSGLSSIFIMKVDANGELNN
jgi:hypothetical protein